MHTTGPTIIRRTKHLTDAITSLLRRKRRWITKPQSLEDLRVFLKVFADGEGSLLWKSELAVLEWIAVFGNDHGSGTTFDRWVLELSSYEAKFIGFSDNVEVPESSKWLGYVCVDDIRFAIRDLSQLRS